MNFDFDQCRTLLHQSLMAALQDNADKIKSLHKGEDIWAIAYEIIPWQPFAALAFRVREESQGDMRYDMGGWKHCEFIGEFDGSLRRDTSFREFHEQRPITTERMIRLQLPAAAD